MLSVTLFHETTSSLWLVCLKASRALVFSSVVSVSGTIWEVWFSSLSAEEPVRSFLLDNSFRNNEQILVITSAIIERVETLKSYSKKEDILYIGHFRKYSNCMLYFHILTYKQGTSEAHFVAKWQHLLHSYQYNVCHIVWIIYMGYVYNR